MKVRKRDYVVAQDENGKRKLILVKSVGEHIKGVVSDREQGSNPEHVSFDLPDVFANLGSKPQHGTYAGVRAEPWRRTWRAEHWGRVHEFRDVPKAERKTLAKFLQRAYKALSRKGLVGFLPLDIEIRPKRGRWAGTYKYHSEKGDTLTFHTETLLEKTLWIIMHEAGHGVWFRMMNAVQRARWVGLYHSTVQRKALLVRRIKNMGKDYTATMGPISAFRKGFGEGNEDDAELFDECLAWIHNTHRLTSKHVDLLMEAGEGKSVLALWPDEDITTSDINDLVSEYGSTSPEEFFAEAFMLYMLKQPLHKRVKKLMRRTLKEVKQ